MALFGPAVPGQRMSVHGVRTDLAFTCADFPKMTHLRHGALLASIDFTELASW